MATLAESLNSSTARPLAVKMRPDLVTEKQRYQGQVYWIVKDPLALSYYRFQEEEFAILNMLDGDTSLDEMKRRFEKNFAPQKITLEELGRLVGMLHSSHLVIADMPGQGTQLRKRHSERVKKEWLGKLANVLAIRFKGFDPERILTRMLPWFGWLFTWRGAVLVLGVAFSALLLVLVQFEQFHAKLPTFHEFFAAKNWIYLATAMGICKVFHEFGHGLSCKKFGGECHEIGAMLLVFTPCLYCNVSDSWMLPNKWQRAMIGAGGMYIELLIAGLATFGWWFSQPGLFNYLCLSTIFVCSVSTIMFNGNPLMRYDGYYILSDIMEIPNLRQKATTILGRKLGTWCLGFKEQEDPFLPQRNQIFFALYSIAATAYMWLVSVSILFFLYRVFEDNGLRVLGHMLAALSLVSLLFAPLWRLCKFFYVPGRMSQVKPWRLVISLSILATLIGAFLFVPLPYRIFCPLEVATRQDAGRVFVDVDGRLLNVFVKPGQRVEKGQKLALLENMQLDLEINKASRDVEESRSRMESARKEKLTPGTSGLNEVRALEQHYAKALEDLRNKLQDREQLLLRSPVDGVVVAPPSMPNRGGNDEEILPSWSGSPLDKENLNATLRRGTLFCQVVDPAKLEGILVVDQSEFDAVQPKQAVEVRFDAVQGEKDWYMTKIVNKSQERMKVASRAVSQRTGGDLETKSNEHGQEVPISASYQARVELNDNKGMLLPGMRGTARIHAEKRTLGYRMWLLIKQTLNFKM
jgi:putative peptide zinc metalloprotease protein